jgi:DNA-binding NarL/FixJ family response regulator
MHPTVLTAGRPVRVVLVEDSALLARELTAALQESGNIDVTAIAASEDEACMVLRADPRAFDVLVVDVFLARGSGLGVLRANHALGLPLKAFVLSNFATLAVRKACVALGAERIFDKSRQFEDFLTVMAALRAPAGAPNVSGR